MKYLKWSVIILLTLCFSGFLLYCCWYHFRGRPVVESAEDRRQRERVEFENKINPENATVDVTDSSLYPQYYIDGKDTIDATYLIKSIAGLNNHAYGSPLQISQSVNTKQLLVFSECSFANNLYFNRDSFNCKVEISNCSFVDSPEREYARWVNAFAFCGLYLKDTFSFYSNEVYTSLIFFHTRFEKKAYFENGALFHQKGISFVNCTLKDGIDVTNLLNGGRNKNKKRINIPDSVSYISFYRDTIAGKVDLSGCHFSPSSDKNKLDFYQSLVDSLDLSGAVFKDTVSLNRENIGQLPEKKWWTKSSFFSFFASPFSDSIFYHKTNINLTNTNLSKLDIDYSIFDLYFDKDATENQKNSIYQLLLDKYQKKGETENYRLVDIDYRDFQGGPINFLSKYWWNYGYNKWWIFLWSFAFVLLFSFINYTLLPKVYFTYSVSSITKYHHWLLKNRRFSKRAASNIAGYIVCLIYTGILFFGVKLEFENIQFLKIRIAILVFAEFLIGLICSGFIIHLILQ